MNHDELKTQVMRALQTSWPSFQAEHPELSHVIDESLLGDVVVESIAKDPVFLEAYERAIESRIGATAMTNMLGQFVATILAGLR